MRGLLDDIPYGVVVEAFRSFRERYFTVGRLGGEYVRIRPTDEMAVLDQVERTEAQLRRMRKLFGVRSYAPNWEFSYHKRGEDLNLARVVYEENPEYPDIVWWQVHIRGWVAEDGSIELTAHWEAEPTENPLAHVESVGWDRERGMKHLKQVLRETDTDFEVFER